MLFSNGDLTPFELTLQRKDEERSVTLASNDEGEIEAQPMQERNDVAESRGFTLIEVLVALAIVTFGMAAVLGAHDVRRRHRVLSCATRPSPNGSRSTVSPRCDSQARLPSKGKTRRRSGVAGRKWVWQQEVNRCDSAICCAST